MLELIEIKMSSLKHTVVNIKKIDGNMVTCTIVKYRYTIDKNGNEVITSIIKYLEDSIELTEIQMNSFIDLSCEDQMRAFMTNIYTLIV